jgi:O-antigen ligase
VGALAIVVAPFALVAGALAQYTLPIRYTLFGIIFLALTLDATDEGGFNSPLAPLGKVLVFNLNQSVPISALALPAITFIMLFLLLLVIQRRMLGARVDGAAPTAQPLLMAMAGSLTAVFVLVTLGMIRGGNLQMAKIQVQSFVQVLLMGYLAAMAFRGMRDYKTLGRLIVVAASLRAVYVLIAAYNIAVRLGTEEIHAAATHGDSLLFSCATVLLIVRFLEKPSGRAAMWCVALLPLLALGMVANNRRLVWVEVAAGLLLFAIISRRSAMKRLLKRLAIMSLPLVIAYIAIGWNSQSKIFAPVRTFRSVSDAKVDPSTMYRDTENYNLMLTMRMNPLTGTGFGQPFAEIVTLPNISFFAEYRYLPHNSILGLWAYTGALGFTGLSLVLIVAVYMAGRSYRRARTAEERIAAFMSIATIAIYAVHCWGDIGFSERRTVLLVGPALAIAGQLACATGAWSARTAKPALAKAA